MEGDQPKPGVKKKLKKAAILSAVVVAIILFCSSIFAFLWLGGYVEGWTCKIVQEDSDIWNSFDCAGSEPETEKSGEGEFQVDVLKDGEVRITDVEEVVTSVVETASPATVGIGLKSTGGNSLQDRIVGSGFIVTSNGLIVTNVHVVTDKVEDMFVLQTGAEEQLVVEKVYRDEVNDIAILKVAATDLPTIPLGDSNKLKVGNTVIAIGNPLGSLTGTVTVGTVSALGRDVDISSGFFGSATKTYSGAIQTDAAINPGNSGGPLINSSGEVIGVNFATISGADNLSFALPINVVKQRIAELNEFGNFRIPFVGVEYRSRVVFLEDKAVVGATLINVVPLSPAETAGLKRGDIVVQFAGQTLEEKSLVDLIQTSVIGTEVDVVIIRDGVTQTLKLTVGDRSDFE